MGIPENSVQSAIEQVCQIYSVPCFREQSRVLKVGNRLVFYGTWKDARGVLHSCGKPDYLTTPRITPLPQIYDGYTAAGSPKLWSIVVPLWVEAKAGKERAAKPNRCMCGDTALDHQEHFHQYVTGSGAYHLIVRDSAEALVSWLKEHGAIRSLASSFGNVPKP